MNYENKIEQTAKEMISLEREDFMAVDNIINKIIISKKNKEAVQHGTRQKSV